MKYICELCGLVYDEEKGLPGNGIAPGTKFEALPADFECPGCYSERHAFSQIGKKQSIPTPAISADELARDTKNVSDR